MVATRKLLDSGYLDLCGEWLRGDSMPLTKPRSWTICEYHQGTDSRHSAETAEGNTASGSTSSTGSASDGQNRVRPMLR
jgi:hypothetical protein